MQSDKITAAVEQALAAWNARQRKGTALELGHSGRERPVTFGVDANDRSSMRWFSLRNTEPVTGDPVYLGDDLRRIAEQADATAREFHVIVELHGKINNVEYDAITLYATERNNARFGDRPNRYDFRLSVDFNYTFKDEATDNARQRMWELGRELFATVFGTASTDEVTEAQAFQRRIVWNHHVVDLQWRATEIVKAGERLTRLLGSQLEASKVPTA